MGGKPKAGNTIHNEANSSIVSSVEHRNCHSQPGRCNTGISLCRKLAGFIQDRIPQTSFEFTLSRGTLISLTVSLIFRQQ